MNTPSQEVALSADPARASRYRMAAEWDLHRRTWMSWPPDGYVRHDGGEPALAAWAAAARAVATFEPLVVLAPPAYVAEAQSYLGDGVQIVACPLDDCWLRDNGPTFTVGDQGEIGTVCWAFNGWGERRRDLTADCAAGRHVASQVRRGPTGTQQATISDLVNEGGGLATDGRGTVIVTETVQCNPNRNPGWDRGAIEAELLRTIGATTVIWLARGLRDDSGPNGTDGHVDTMVAFLEPGVVAVHHQPDPTHPDHAVMTENEGRLRAAHDATGRALEVVRLVAPPPREDHAGHESYVNFAWVNGGIVVGRFGDADTDTAAVAVLATARPDRCIVTVDATQIFRHGGGVHCITLAEPASPATPPPTPPPAPAPALR